jgi:pyruvate/2-oxoglutarate/acetoin dehydrogenase E1 component
VLDMRTLCPIDWETILESVARTGRCLIVHEDHADFGVGAEVAAQLAERAFVDLDAPIRRVGAAFHPVPFSPILEDATLPSVSGILTAITDLAEF